MRAHLPPAHPLTASVWWTPLELARRWAGLCREAGLEAIASFARTGDRLAAIERPDSRLARVISEELARRDEQAVARQLRWLLKGSRIDVDA